MSLQSVHVMYKVFGCVAGVRLVGVVFEQSYDKLGLHNHATLSQMSFCCSVITVTLVMTSSSCHSVPCCHPLQKAPEVASPPASEKKPGTVDLCESVQKRVSNTLHHTPFDNTKT